MKNKLDSVIWLATAMLGLYCIILLIVRQVQANNKEIIITPDMIVLPETQDDWAESANALGVDPDSMTVQQFLEHSNR